MLLHLGGKPPLQKGPGLFLFVGLVKYNARSLSAARPPADRTVGLPCAGYQCNPPPAVQLRSCRQQLNVHIVIRYADRHRSAAEMLIEAGHLALHRIRIEQVGPLFVGLVRFRPIQSQLYTAWFIKFHAVLIEIVSEFIGIDIKIHEILLQSRQQFVDVLPGVRYADLQPLQYILPVKKSTWNDWVSGTP